MMAKKEHKQEYLPWFINNIQFLGKIFSHEKICFVSHWDF